MLGAACADHIRDYPLGPWFTACFRILRIATASGFIREYRRLPASQNAVSQIQSSWRTQARSRSSANRAHIAWIAVGDSIAIAICASCLASVSFKLRKT